MALNTRSPRSGKIKITLLVTAFCIIVPILFYTHNLVNELQHKEHEVARLYARSMEYLANSPYTGADYSFVFNEMILAIDFPVILPLPCIITTMTATITSMITPSIESAVRSSITVYPF